jgi:diguanylate cyclase (GGDEF)-like protein/PAS domain S-box-containing protein
MCLHCEYNIAKVNCVVKKHAIKKKTEKEADAVKLPKTTKHGANKGKRDDAPESGSFNEAVLEALPIGVCLTDETGHYRFMNEAYCSIYEYVREEMIGQHYGVIMPPDQIALANKQYARLLKGDTGIPVERKRQRKDGSIIYIEAANALVKLPDGRRMVITTVREITERKQMEAELKKANDAFQALHATLREQATRDSLTGLYNRRYFNETIERELARAKRDNYPVSVMIMDIDLFKDINDSYGHAFGDEALRVLSALINVNIRAGDIAYRYGGDEFVVVMPGADISIARLRAEMVSRTFSAAPIHEGKQNFAATISVGIAIYPQHGSSGDEILRCADSALYQAKQDGRNHVYVWKRE